MRLDFTAVTYDESDIEGHGVFTTRRVYKDELLFVIIQQNISQPLNRINHSCHPNCAVRDRGVFPIRDLKEGEEATIDYETINVPVVRLDFSCNCGAIECRH